MTAIAEAGRALGATVALADANLRSPLPVPFYELRMGDTRRAVIPPAARLIAAPVSPGGWNRFAIEVAGLDDLVADLRQRAGALPQ
ncbi:MAG TPA: hypothetical protein VFV41_23305 [Streptosporangiaceae bacterium]|nr:hypothetical protein [Streptosporangiaceae bacterium]